MDFHRVIAFVHLFLSIILVGLALFWWIMLVALRQRFDAAQTSRLLRVANGARWPHVAVPHRLRVPLPFMTWIVLILLALTGLEMGPLPGIYAGTLLDIKLVLVGVVVVLQAALTGSPKPALIPLNLLCVLAIAVVSALMIRV